MARPPDRAGRTAARWDVAPSTSEAVEGDGELPSMSEESALTIGHFPQRRSGFARGMLAVAAVSTSQVAASQMTRSAQLGLHAPFFVMCLHTGLMAACLPLARALTAGGERICAPARAVALLLPLWGASSYLYVAALYYAPPGLVQTIFGAAPAVVTLLSCIFLAEPFTARRAVAVTMAFAGMTTVGLNAWLQAGPRTESSIDDCIGALFAGSAVLAAAGYKVGFKVCFHEPTAAVVLGVVGSLGAAAALCGFPLAVALTLSGAEDCWWDGAAGRNWPLLLGSAAVDVLYGVSVAFGIAAASPVFVALGTILGIPANLLFDALVRRQKPAAVEAVGAVLVVVSFVLLAATPACPEPEPRASGEAVANQAARVTI